MFRRNGGDGLSDGPTAEDNIPADHEKEQNHQQDLALNNELLAAFYWHTTNNSTNGSCASDKGKGKVAVQCTDRDQGRKLKRNSSSSAAAADGSCPSVSWADYTNYNLINNNNNNILKPNHHEDDDAEDLYKKKILHRDTERQRRQDMSGLYSKLQTLLPREYVEGKRSMSDHICGSVNYIKHLKRNITDLQDKKDWLIKATEEETSWTDFEVVINQPSGVGYEVQIRVPLKAEWFSLSRALEVLLDEGLDVFTYSSARVNKYLIHTIHCQVREENINIDINGARLQQRIYETHHAFQ